MNDQVVRTEGLTKVYRGGHVGVSDLDLEVRRGEVFGFLGPNGAGKTTTIRMALDLIRPTRGRIEVLGIEVRRGGARLRQELGYLPGDLTLYPQLTGHETLTFFAHLRGLTDLAHALQLAERLDLDLSRKVHELSKGNRQKLGVVQALMHRPALAVLDEPTSGLDPVVQHEFYALLRETVAEGRTVVLSSHVMSEVEHLADRVAILRSGRLAVVDDIDRLKAQALRQLDLEFSSPVPETVFAGTPGVRSVHADGTRVTVEVSGPVGPLMKVAADRGLVSVTSHEPDLEQIFLGYVAGGAPDAVA